MAGLATPEHAAAEASSRIDAEIQLTLVDSPSLRRRYAEAVTLQQKIDSHRQEGRPIPIEWIKNPFHRVYYESKGWVDSVTTRSGA